MAEIDDIMEGLLEDDEDEILEEADVNPEKKSTEEFSPTQNVLLSQKDELIMES